MIIRIRKIEAGKLTVTKLYFGAEKREVILLLPQQSNS